MTTSTLARRETAVAVPEPTQPQVRRVLPLSVALALVSASPAVLAAWSLYDGRTGHAQFFGGVVAVMLLGAFNERYRERRR